MFIFRVLYPWMATAIFRVVLRFNNLCIGETVTIYLVNTIYWSWFSIWGQFWRILSFFDDFWDPPKNPQNQKKGSILARGRMGVFWRFCEILMKWRLFGVFSKKGVFWRFLTIFGVFGRNRDFWINIDIYVFWLNISLKKYNWITFSINWISSDCCSNILVECIERSVLGSINLW